MGSKGRELALGRYDLPAFWISSQSFSSSWPGWTGGHERSTGAGLELESSMDATGGNPLDAIRRQVPVQCRQRIAAVELGHYPPNATLVQCLGGAVERLYLMALEVELEQIYASDLVLIEQAVEGDRTNLSTALPNIERTLGPLAKSIFTTPSSPEMAASTTVAATPLFLRFCFRRSATDGLGSTATMRAASFRKSEKSPHSRHNLRRSTLGPLGQRVSRLRRGPGPWGVGPMACESSKSASKERNGIRILPPNIRRIRPPGRPARDPTHRTTRFARGRCPWTSRRTRPKSRTENGLWRRCRSTDHLICDPVFLLSP